MTLQELVPSSWSSIITEDYISQIEPHINLDTCKPEPSLIFRPFQLIQPHQVKVIIIGEDPYPGTFTHKNKTYSQACGLAFSTSRSCHKPPASLRNIFACLRKSYPDIRTDYCDLTSWVLQGVLLINTSFTLKTNGRNHWESLTKHILESLITLYPNIIMVAWGNKAKAIVHDCCSQAHILEAYHPSPQNPHWPEYVACGHFKKINDRLEEIGESLIDFELC